MITNEPNSEGDTDESSSDSASELCDNQPASIYSFQTIYPCASTEKSHFGSFMAKSENRLFIADLPIRYEGSRKSSIYVFEKRDGRYSQTAIINAKDQKATDFFGMHMAALGDTLVATSFVDGEFLVGSKVYVFKLINGKWVQKQILARPANVKTKFAADEFGKSLALNSESLFVGVPNADAVVEYRLDAKGDFVYHNQLTTKYDSAIANPKNIAAFGDHLTLKGDILLVTTLFGMSKGIPSGTVHVFQKQDGEMQEVALLEPKKAKSSASFGFSTDIENGKIAVGAPHDAHGKVYIYEQNNYSLERTLEAPDQFVDWYDARYNSYVLYPRTLFGRNVHFEGKNLIVITQSQNHMYNLRNSGSIFVYKDLDSGILFSLQTLNDDLDPNSTFIGGVVYDEGSVLIGSSYNGSRGLFSGRVNRYPLALQ